VPPLAIAGGQAGAKGWIAASAGPRVFLWEEKDPNGAGWADTQSNGDGDFEIYGDEHQPAHGDSVRTLGVSPCGNFVASGAEDKYVKVWSTSDRKCVRAMCLPKRVSALSFSIDSKYVFAGDKYGEVYAVPTDAADGSTKPVLLLGHLCSIITYIAVSPCGQFIATADRDGKIRISSIPKAGIAGGIHEIQSYCLGHDGHVQFVQFVSSTELVSGGGDGCVRLWSVEDGAEKECVQPHEGTNVLSATFMPESSTVAVLFGNKKVSLLSIGSGTLTLKESIDIPQKDNLVPISIASVNTNSAYLWIVGTSESTTSLAVYAQMHKLALPTSRGSAHCELSDALSPWKSDAKPVVVEDRTKFNIHLVSSELKKFVFPLSEREFRKRRRKDVLRRHLNKDKA